MYGKIFESMYEGTLYGQWEAIVTMQQFIVIANEDGVVDMTPPHIAGKTSIPLEIIEKGIDILSKPDPYSRTPGDEGIRIALLDDHRPWGWYIVNYKKYRDMVRREDKKEADRIRVKASRDRVKCDENANKNNDVAECRKVSQPVANVAHTDTDTYTLKDIGQNAPRLTARFEDFWKAYPKKRKKKTAKEIWRRKKLDRLADQLIADVGKRQAQDTQWKEGYIPDPTTYLNQERWEDELAPTARTGTVKHRQPEVVTEEMKRRDREKANRELAALMERRK